ncbi:surface-adhesin E family protein [Anabaena sp. FACHB-709]|uniref:Surface-adhesin protein E-like domain-containing protein n=2 Tax=Nostocaceae TaxID=1162 RepID=A0A1Z4KU13_ANAVA|nr:MULTISPECIES: surface-adhesin E family protein [Nostocaceae]BAY72505.1 hypothetical protein NIES23_53300 [Trichormus variabilis NIES-23]HBW29460.1 hypothetical protein [Nostoc sp. UBA8866]MBD2170884.1 hypothetical protein [Anabaena cylindrica FACHB-318]MBD2262669.1 hypothetical protein [Anabaena sp. FACHB-709]MBD2272216.1 hypothetical protein [Nostoc sp. PCC 7120 = FACHB-418]
MKALLFGGLLALSAALPAAAVDWVLVAGDSVKEHYIDNDSIRTDGQNFLYNTKVIDFQRQEINITKQGMNCNNALSYGFTMTRFTMNGRLINSVTFNEPNFVKIREGSAPSIIYQSLCL